MVESKYPAADAAPHGKYHIEDATVRVYDVGDVTPEVLAELRAREDEYLKDWEEYLDR